MTLQHTFWQATSIASASALTFFAACQVPDDAPPELAVQSTHQSVLANTPIKISGSNMSFLANEATTGQTGTDLNGDGDDMDTVPFAVNLQNSTEVNIGVEATSIAWLNNDLYMITNEMQDGRDWSGNGNLNDIVLLNWNTSSQSTTFLDVVAPDPNPSAPTPRMIATPSNLFYVSGSPPPGGAHTSTIHAISISSPTTHTPVPTDDAVGALSPCLLAQDESLVFLALDEVTEARDLNGDSDATDEFVLALLDGTTSVTTIRNTALAMPNGDGPFRAAQTGSPNDWHVGFLVSETAQGATNFNNYTVGAAKLTAEWLPPQCISTQNNETTDDILFFILYASWVSSPVNNPPRNTGLVGAGQISIANGFVATISDEADVGCDLNDNGEMEDNVVTWTQLVSGATTPILPLNDPNNLHALYDVAGGTHGLAELQQGSSRVFVIEASEAADDKDLDGNGFKISNLLGWLSPSNNSTPWDFTQGGSNNTSVGASWLFEQPDHSRLDTAFVESLIGSTLNPGGDGDILDSVPTFGVFSGTNAVFPGVAVAVQATNAGIVALNNYGFFRVDEMADNRDWNQDGDKTDIVLMRVSFTQSTTAVMGTLDPNLMGPVIPVNFQVPENGGAFIFNEASVGPTGTDVNGDGSIHPFVSYFHF